MHHTFTSCIQPSNHQSIRGHLTSNQLTTSKSANEIEGGSHVVGQVVDYSHVPQQHALPSRFSISLLSFPHSLAEHTHPPHSLVVASMPPPQPPAAPSTLQHYIGRLPCSSSVLLLLAIRFVVALSLGYIHPDEFFQSPEVTASSIFDTHSFIPWEFADTSNPCRYHLSASTHLSTANQLTTQLTCPTMSMSMMMMLLLQEHRPSVRNERSAVSTVTNRTLSYRMVAR